MSTKSEELTLTYDERSPFARVVLVVINELEISVKKDLIDLSKMFNNKSEDFMKMNPRGLIPILTVGDDSFGERYISKIASRIFSITYFYKFDGFKYTKNWLKKYILY